MMNLLIDYTPFQCTPEMVQESRKLNEGRIVLKGLLQCAEKTNQNGRVYPRNILEREVENYQRLVKTRRSVGELDHPDTPVVEFKNVSHVISSVWMEGNDVYGEIEVLDNLPNGKILAGLVERGIPIGISSRGLGSTKNQGSTAVVQDDFRLVCWDIVSEPSTHNAFVMKEGLAIDSVTVEKVFDRYDGINRAITSILTWAK